MSITQEQRARLRELLAAATAGPWSVNRHDAYNGDINWQIQSDHAGEGDLEGFEVLADICESELGSRTRSTAALIAEMRNALPELLDALDAAEAKLARIETWTHRFGAALCPKRADTYGEGMRDAKQQVSDLLRAALGESK